MYLFYRNHFFLYIFTLLSKSVMFMFLVCGRLDNTLPSFSIWFYLHCCSGYFCLFNKPDISFKIMFEQWWSSIPPISTITPHLNSLNTKKTTTLEIHRHKKGVFFKLSFWLGCIKFRRRLSVLFKAIIFIF